ncbi:hypothetical protein [Tenacibaculum piscium]|uniref:hypothetical protein n=1 Tax=Tenacibaculum piscium TaxID=1458515 RepID=UPI00187BBC73|nr:hypothetical protein [Tenacibaculum piscium]MBE7630491.1 hypothetical protein [Tenacibaculum piscium]MBE7671687.1 hypothetical protein [Tenacibaculum piscium]
MSEIKDISNSLELTLKDSNLQGVTVGIAETLTDSILEDGILKDIPVISTIVGLGKVGFKIKDRLFLKKIITFISELNEISIEKRNEIISKIDESKQFRIKIGEKLLYIIDKCDDHEKSQLIGRLFKDFLEEKIDYDSFLRCSVVVDKAMPEDLMWFVNHDWEKLSIEESGDYLNWGIFEISPLSININETFDHSSHYEQKSNYEVEGGELRTEITFIGRKLREALKE